MTEEKATLPPFPGWGEIPPADLILDPKVPRPCSQVHDTIVDFVSRQPVLKTWLAARVKAYMETGAAWTPGAAEYAAARDAASWQLGRTPSAVFQLLMACEMAAPADPKPAGAQFAKIHAVVSEDRCT